ncbi:MAG: hypothetical protein ABI402_08200 [Ferruginibacter sp.]
MNARLTTLILITLLFLSSCVTPAGTGYVYTQPVFVYPGVGLGTIIVVVSWTRNKSILWAIIHTIPGRHYVIYIFDCWKEKIFFIIALHDRFNYYLGILFTAKI